MFEKYSKEQLQENLQTMLVLEWLGVHVEDVKNDGINTFYYFSVPESSTIHIDDPKAEDMNDKIKTSDGLIELFKNEVIDMLIEYCEDTYGKEDPEFIEEVKKDWNEYFKFYAKVRTGEVWNKEMGDAAVNKINNEILAVSAYKEV